MDDLKDYNFRVKLVYGFAQNPEQFINSAQKFINSNNDFQKMRICAIYNVLTSLIAESATKEELFEKLSNSSASTTQSVLSSLKAMLVISEGAFENLKNYIKVLEGNIIDAGLELSVIKEDILNPVHPSDLIFLSKISRSSLSESNNDGFTLEEMSTPGFKSKVAEMFYEVPYYFEQAFSNTDIKIQSILLDYIRDKHDTKDELQVKEYSNLSDLYMLSDIDNLTLRIKNPTSIHQAFQKFLGLLSDNKKPKLMNKILKENVIMRALFLIDPRNPFQGLIRLFATSHYPYNSIILTKYKQVMFKKDKDMDEIMTTLMKDETFSKAYLNYLNVKDTLEKKRKIDNFIETSKNQERNELKQEIISIYDMMMGENLNTDVLHEDNLLEYSRKLNQIIMSANLHMDDEVNKKLNKYFIFKLNLYLNDKRSKKNSKSLVFGIDPIDVWYDVNQIFEANAVDSYDKVYLKYSEKYAYEFAPKEKLKVSNRELPLREIRSLPESHACIICTEEEEKRFNLFDLYINRLYQRIYKVTFKDKIKVTFKEDKKSPFKGAVINSTVTDENTFRKFINDYSALVFIIGKDPEFFKAFYQSKAKELLSEMISFEKSYEEIKEAVKLNTIYDYREIFSDRNQLKRILTELCRSDANIMENMKEFISLAPVNTKEFEKNATFTK